MFYDRFASLCKARGLTPTAVVKAAGISTGSIGHWKTGALPKLATLRKLANYLGADVSELTGGEQKEKPADEGGQIANAEAREAFREGGVRVYLDAGNKLSDEDLQDVYEFIRWKQREIGR